MSLDEMNYSERLYDILEWVRPESQEGKMRGQSTQGFGGNQTVPVWGSCGRFVP